MPLRFDLPPFDKLYIGKSIILNSHERAFFVIEGETPVLKSKDVLLVDRAVSAIEKLYYTVQQIYLEDGFDKYQGTYFALTVQAVSEDPSTYAVIDESDALVRNREFYKALKNLKKLIKADLFRVDRSEPGAYVRRPLRGAV